MRALDQEARLDAFYKCWAQKEAYVWGGGGTGMDATR